jgi:hypothetical protein
MKECICKLKYKKFNLLFNKEDNFHSFIENFQNFTNFDENLKLVNFMQNPEYKLEDDEWFKLDIEILEKNIKNHINKIFNLFENSGDISHIEKDKFYDVKLIMYGEKNNDEWKINCQVIHPSKILKEDKKFLFLWNNGIKVFKQENLIILEDKIDFIINSKNILFKKLSDLNNIHGDFKHLYKEASQEEVENIFIKELKNIVIMNENLIKEHKISSLNLKKIKFHKDNGIFEEIKKRPTEFINYLTKYPLLKDIVKDDTIKIESDNDMKILLKACSQQVYKGEFTHEDFLASGNKKLKD